jgi:alpha-beta hydrolase superfamily lysophospholipase
MKGALSIALLLSVVSSVSCSPRIMHPGKSTQPASLEDDRLIMADGAELPLRRWEPKAPPVAIVLALHGFNDYSKAFEKAGAFWAENGILTYAYDQRGFGDAPFPSRWHGASALTDDLASASRLIRKRHEGAPFFLLGESMGGAVIMAATANGTLPAVSGLILSAPAVWSRSIMPGWQKAALSFFSHTMPGLRVSGGGFGRKPSDNIEMLKALSRDPKIIKRTRFDAVYGLVNLMDRALEAAPSLSGPTLILYGKREDIIPSKARQALENRLPPKPCLIRIEDYESGYHMLLRDLEAEIVWRDILTWLADPTAPLQSRPNNTEKRLACARRLP